MNCCHTGIVTLQFTADGDQLLTGWDDGGAALWSLKKIQFSGVDPQ